MLSVDASRLKEALRLTEEHVTKSKVAQFDHKLTELLPKSIADSISSSTRILAKSRATVSKKFMVITGIDKSGKETHAFNPRGLAGLTSAKDYLARIGYRPLTVSLPSYDTLLGSLVSAYLKRSSGIHLEGSLDPQYAWMLWSLDRVQHLNKISRWIRKAGHVALAKRWLESNIVYQSVMGIDIRRILRFEKNVIKQGYTIILDIPVKESLARKGTGDLYETEDTLQKVRNLYLDLPALYPYGSFYIIDASRTLKEVNRDLIALLASLPPLA